MSSDRIDEKLVFNAARGIGDAAARERYLRAACGEDADAVGRIRELLRGHEEARSFLESPAVALVAPQAPLESAGTVIGPYKLLEQIGEGGFGVVFMAEQMEPVRRRVALKVIKPGMDTRQVIARFEAERQALALMDHPHIAMVLDAGATATGRPYFVMELVRGLPITEYCDAHRLTPRERLDLFVTVCRAVQHAHQKGIIHRDIKPSNVLVTLLDDRPVVKVIDFGVAKATNAQLTERTLFTGFAQMVGTPLYMSPEQASLSAVDVDTRSDIYSLGVLLYELLTGATPFDGARLKKAAFDEVLRIIRDEEPQTPSTRLGTSEGLDALAARRGMEPAKLTRLVRGELDWIVMKALEKDRARRYETASGLATDVGRYLADEAVTACPPSAWYRLRKLARRRRGALAAATLLGATLLVLAGSFGWMARDGAARRARTAEAVAALLDQCEEALRSDAMDRAALALEAAERRAAEGGARGLGDRLARCRADLGLLRELDAIGTFHWTWTGGRFAQRPALVERWRHAFAAYGVSPDAGDIDAAAARIEASPVRRQALAALDRWLVVERSARVRALLQAIDADSYRDAVRDAALADDAPALIALTARPEALAQPEGFVAALGRLGAIPVERSRAILESALRARPGSLALLMELGNSYMEVTGEPQGESERVRWFQAAAAAHPKNVAARNNLGFALWVRGDLEGAIARYEEAIGLDPTFALGHYNLGVAFDKRGEPDRARACYEEAIRIDPTYASSHYNLGVLYDRRGDPDRALACYEAAIRIDPTFAEAHHNRGYALWDRGEHGAAVDSLRAAVAARPEAAEMLCDLGTFLTRLGHFSEAVEWLRRGHELGSRRPDWRYPSADWVREAERLLALDARLPHVLAGQAASPEERLALADLCLQYRNRYAEAVLLYDHAFVAEPGLADGIEGRRYNAACAAVLAASGRGAGAADLTPAERARLLGLALGWLQAELAAQEQLLAGGPAAGEGVRSVLQHWLADRDLSYVRDAHERSSLSADERERWVKLWRDVRDLLARAGPR